MSASLLLLSRLKGKLYSTMEVRIRSLQASIGLILHSAAQLMGYSANDPELLQNSKVKVNETLSRLYQYLKEWVCLPTIFGPSFGCHLLGSASRELKVHICNCFHTLLLCNHYYRLIYLFVDVGIHYSDRLSRGNYSRVAQYCSEDCH